MSWTWQEKTYESCASLEEAKRRHYEAISAKYRAISAKYHVEYLARLREARLMPRLRSIPPANRGSRSRDRVSSMRAASRVGMTFVGGSIGSAGGGRQTHSDFTVEVKKPDPAMSQMREAFRDAYQRMVEQIEALLAMAEEEGENDYWAGELERLSKGGK